MGAYYSELGELRQSEANLLSENVNFSSKEVQALFARFKKLDRSGAGVISRDNLLKIPELAMNPLVDRIVDCFEADDEGNVTFTAFLQCLSHLSTSGTIREKLALAFRVYDINNDGFISIDELTQILRLMVGAHMTDEEIQKTAITTIDSAASDGEKISRDDFYSLFGDREDEISRIFTIEIVTRD